MAAAATTETVTLQDGTTIDLAKVPNVDDATWTETKAYLAENPEMARKLLGFSKDPEAMRGWLQTQVIAKHYGEKLEGKDEVTTGKVKALSEDPELAAVFDDIKKNGQEAMLKYIGDEELMLKISRKMGGIPQGAQDALTRLEQASLTVHEAAKNGDLKSVQEFLAKSQALDTQDPKGITALGYAIGANRIAVVKLLLDSRANPHAVDSAGNSGLHYAAGYGRKELCEYLIKCGVSLTQPNAQGQTPLSVAMQNKHTATIQLLQGHGATAPGSMPV